MVEMGLDSEPVTPLISGLRRFIQPSMWSKERFSMTRTTTVLIGPVADAPEDEKAMRRVWSRMRKRSRAVGMVGIFVGVGGLQHCCWNLKQRSWEPFYFFSFFLFAYFFL